MSTKNVTINGVSYTAVPAVDIPITGTTNKARFVEISDTTAVETDVASGKTFYKSDGTKATGTLSGGAITIVDTDDENGGIIREINSDLAIAISSLTVTSNGTYTGETTPVKKVWDEVIVNVSGGSVNIQSNKNATPTESQQIIKPDTSYDALSQVTVAGITSTYVGSGVTRRTSTDLTASNATVTVPAGYYSAQASKSVSSMTLPTSASSTSSGTSKATITPSTSAQYLNIPTGYNSSAQYYTVSGITTMILPTSASGTSSGTNKATIGRSTSAQYINIPTGYNSAAAFYTISATPNGSVTTPSTISGTTATVSTGTNTLTLTKTISVTPSVTTAGYISSGTAGNANVSLTANVSVNPTPTVSGATVTIPAGYYSEQTTKSVSSGSATGPSSLSGSSATVTTGTNTITLTKTGVTTTPTVSAGYVSNATASTATVALTASVTTKAAATITPGTTNQTIAAGTYLTGTQTIAGDADLVGSNILSGVNIFGVSGTVTFQTIYSGSSAPSSSTGVNGDIYIQI